MSSAHLVIGCAYIPPNQHSSAYYNFCQVADEAIGLSGEIDRVLLMGDFNLPLTDWSARYEDIDDSSRHMLDLAMVHDLKQVNNVTNYRGVSLDLVFSSIPDTIVMPAIDRLIPEDRHHPALDISIRVYYYSHCHSTKYIPDFRNCNLDQILRQLQGRSYPTAGDINDVDMSFSNFIDYLSSLVQQNTPTKKVTKSNFPKWFTNDLRNLVIKKKIAHKKFKTTGCIYELERFRSLRRECKTLVTICYNNYISKVEDSIPANIKCFWSHVDNLKNTSSMPPEMTLDGSEAHDSFNKCELFARHFSSVFCQADIPVPTLNFGWSNSLSGIVVSATDVQSKLEALDPNKSAGPDNIPPSVLKFCAPVLAVHLAILFNALLSSGIFPSSLKRGYAVPIYKSGDRSNIKNYRPIVIQSSIAKVFESLVLDHLYFYLKTYISAKQHGFLRGRSTITNLLEFQEYVTSAFINSCQVDCIYLDFSKAFDKVHHGLLISKLAAYGVTGRLLQWLDSYLRGRVLYVKCDGVTSTPFEVLSGVPQGSHLGPLLFNMFINDISCVLSVACLLFADDIKIFTRVRSSSDQENLQQSLSNIASWCVENGMELNVTKCQVVSFSRLAVTFTHDYQVGGSSLRRVNNVKDLGVYFTSTLNPVLHIMDVTSRANSLIGFINRSTKHFRSPQSLIILYKMLVRPVLEYGSVIWTPYQRGHVELLYRVQVRFMRMLGTRLGYTYFGTPIEELEQHFNLHPLQHRRIVIDLVFLYKLVNGLMDCPELLQRIDLHIPRGTRSMMMFGRGYLPTNYSYHCGLARLQRTGSAVSSRIDFFSETLNSFRRKVTSMSAAVIPTHHTP